MSEDEPTATGHATGSFCLDEQRQAIDADDDAALPVARAAARRCCARVHDRAAQLDAADLAGRDVLLRDRGLADQRVDVHAVAIELHPAHQRAAEEQQRRDREDRKQEQLDPDRPPRRARARDHDAAMPKKMM